MILAQSKMSLKIMPPNFIKTNLFERKEEKFLTSVIHIPLILCCEIKEDFDVFLTLSIDSYMRLF